MEQRVASVTRWTLAAFAMDLVHDLDHVRRHNYSPITVRSLGFVALAGGILAVALVLRRHRFAVPFACFYGFASGIGLILVHVIPHWGPISDPFTAYRVDALSWLILGANTAVDLMLGIVATQQLRAHAQGTEGMTVPGGAST